jgi:hypothetical protein
LGRLNAHSTARGNFPGEGIASDALDTVETRFTGDGNAVVASRDLCLEPATRFSYSTR